MGTPDNGFSLNTTDNVRFCADGSVLLVEVMPKGGGGLRVCREKNRACYRSFLTMEFERDNVANSYLQMAGILLGAHVLLVLLWICLHDRPPLMCVAPLASRASLKRDEMGERNGTSCRASLQIPAGEADHDAMVLAAISGREKR
jgi:hypothetical protein